MSFKQFDFIFVAVSAMIIVGIGASRFLTAHIVTAIRKEI